MGQGMDGWKDGWLDGWREGYMDGSIQEKIRIIKRRNPRDTSYAIFSNLARHHNGADVNTPKNRIFCTPFTLFLKFKLFFTDKRYAALFRHLEAMRELARSQPIRFTKK